MYELIHAVGNTYYINCPAKMGVYREADNGVWLIDSGNDKEAGKKVFKILAAQGWTLRAILNTHSNADHIGGNRILQERTGCPIYVSGMECGFVNHPLLEPSFLYGGYPLNALRNKFLMAQPSSAHPLSEAKLPAGMEILPLPGHFFEMVGFRTPDGVCFLADCLSGANVLEKYHVSFLYDVAAYLQTLNDIQRLRAELFVPAHAEVCAEIAPLAERNRAKVEEILRLLCFCCEQPHSFEEILKMVFDHYGLTMDMNQYVLIGSTIRSYLSYLCGEEQLQIIFSENRMLWSHPVSA